MSDIEQGLKKVPEKTEEEFERPGPEKNSGEIPDENTEKNGESPLKKKGLFTSEKAMGVRQSVWLNLVYCLGVPLVTLVTLEWIARGTLGPHQQGNGFFQAIVKYFPSFIVAYILLMFVYIFIAHLFGSHLAATIAVGCLGNIPAVATYYKLTMRNEPFLPWDVTQIGDLMGVGGNVSLDIQPSMIVTALLFVLLSFGAYFVIVPRNEDGKPDWKTRLTLVGISGAGILLLMFCIFLSPKGTAAIGIKEDMWMQDRYYRKNGVITGFLTNLQMLNIDEPKGYSQQTVLGIAHETEENAEGEGPLYENAPAATGDFAAEQPDIIYVMAESFWDVTALEGIEYDRDLLPNLTALAEEGAYGTAYTPSFGGGTCDVEFEALTGFSVENLPAGSKPYQQYVTGDMSSLPQLLKEDGYETLAIHGYGRRFWNRDQAYPRLGIDTFIAEDDFENPVRRRGFISDDAMVDRIIEEHSTRASDDNPVFIHAVTMQNHTTYDRGRYAAGELVRVTDHPVTIPDKTIGQLEDCATGISEMDAALGKLTEYLRTVERPTILVFWGDHMNPMSDGFRLFEETGFIAKDDTTNPALHQTPLLIWSNQSQNQIDLGTVATYDLSPVMMDLYGLDKPLYFEFLRQEMDVVRVRTRGYTVSPDGGISEEMTEEQQDAVWQQSVLQYDYMFGENYLEAYLNGENSS